MTDDPTVCRCCRGRDDVQTYAVTVMVRAYSYHGCLHPIDRALVLDAGTVPICRKCRVTVYAVPRLEAEEEATPASSPSAGPPAQPERSRK